MNKITKVLDEVLAKFDSMMSGKQNIVFKTDLNELRNFIVEIQEREE